MTLLAPRYVPGEATYLHVPPGRVGSHGDTVCEVAEMMHRPLEPHQVAAVDALNSYGPGGAWLTLEAAIVGPRQTTGKTSAVLLPTVVADLFTWRAPGGVAWTAHRMKTTRETFTDLKNIIEGSEEFSRRVKRVSETDSDEHVEFVGGSKVEFLARSPGAGRGLGRRLVVVDEALYFGSSMAGDLLPVMVSQTNPRVLYASSAPKGTSDHLQNLVERGRSGDPTLIYVEYRCPGSLDEAGCSADPCSHDRGTPGCRLDDEQLWRFGSPGLVSGRVAPVVVRALRATLEPLEFAREMLGWEEDADGVETIPVKAWLSRVDASSGVRKGSRPVFAVEVSPDRRTASIGVAGPRKGGGVHLGLIAREPGVDWLVKRVRELVAKHDPRAVALDGSSPAGSLVATLVKPVRDGGAGLTLRTADDPSGLLVVTTGVEAGKACGGLYDAVTAKDSDVWHRGDELVTAAWKASAPRPVGDGGWAIGRKASGGDVTAAAVMPLAHYVLATTPESDALDNIW